MRRSYEISEPVAILIHVSGQPGPDGDFMAPVPNQVYTGRSGGETLLSQWQVDDLLARGYELVG